MVTLKLLDKVGSDLVITKLGADVSLVSTPRITIKNFSFSKKAFGITYVETVFPTAEQTLAATQAVTSGSSKIATPSPTISTTAPPTPMETFLQTNGTIGGADNVNTGKGNGDDVPSSVVAGVLALVGVIAGAAYKWVTRSGATKVIPQNNRTEESR